MFPAAACAQIRKRTLDEQRNSLGTSDRDFPLLLGTDKEKENAWWSCTDKVGEIAREPDEE